MVTATRSVVVLAPRAGVTLPPRRVSSFIRRSNMPVETSAVCSSTTASFADA